MGSSEMDPTALVPILVALFAGGGVAFYLAKPNKESINVSSSEKALTVVTAAIERLEKELKAALARIAVLESELLRSSAATALALQVSSEATAEALRVASEAAAEALRVTTVAATTAEKRITELHAEVRSLQSEITRLGLNG